MQVTMQVKEFNVIATTFYLSVPKSETLLLLLYYSRA